MRWRNAAVRIQWRWTIVINSRNPSSSSCSHLCRQNEANKCAHVERAAEHPPFLKIGCAERRLKIGPPLITASLKYLSAAATFKHCSLLLGFYSHYHLFVLIMEIPRINMFFIHFYPCSLHLDLHCSSPSSVCQRMQKITVDSWLGCFVSAVLNTVVFLWSVWLVSHINFSATPPLKWFTVVSFWIPSLISY